MLNPKEIKKQDENRKNQEQKITGLKEQIEIRRKKVYFLDLQGFSNQEIANQLGNSLSTIEKDLHYMKYYCVKWFEDLAQDGSGLRTIETCSQIDIVQKELWSLYRKEKLASTKKRILDSIVANSLKKGEISRGFYRSSDELEREIKKWGKEIDIAIAEEYGIKI